MAGWLADNRPIGSGIENDLLGHLERRALLYAVWADGQHSFGFSLFCTWMLFWDGALSRLWAITARLQRTRETSEADLFDERAAFGC